MYVLLSRIQDTLAMASWTDSKCKSTSREEAGKLQQTLVTVSGLQTCIITTCAG